MPAIGSAPMFAGWQNSAMTRTAPRPLVVRFGSVGDMVLLTGLLSALHQRYQMPCDLLSGTGWPADLLAEHPDVGEVHRLESRRRPYWTDPRQWRVVDWLRHRPPGPVYVCDDLQRAALRRLLDRAGIPADHRLFFDDAELAARRHWFDRLADMAVRLPPAWAGTVEARPPAFPDQPTLIVPGSALVDLAQWRAERGLTGQIVLIQPGNKRTQRHGRFRSDHHKWWPIENWAQTITAVLESLPEAAVVLCGAPSEQALLLAIADQCRDRRVHACGDQLPMLRLMALANCAHSMIAVDSGPAHIAAALACPSVVLFGAAPTWLWTPKAPPGVPVVTVGGEPDGLDRVDRIGPDRVIAAWRTLAGRIRT